MFYFLEARLWTARGRIESSRFTSALRTIRGVEPGQSHEGMRSGTVRRRSPRSALRPAPCYGVLERQHHDDPEAFPRRGPRQGRCHQLACCRNLWLYLAAGVGSLFSLGSISVAAESADGS
jgi:hypothetical protein